MPQHYIRALAVDADGALWIGTGLMTGVSPPSPGGLSRLDKEGRWQTFTTASTKGGLPKDAVTALALGAAGTLWIGTELGLARRDKDGSWQTYKLPDVNGSPSNNNIRAVALGRDGVLWVGTYDGLARLDKGGGWLPSLTAVNSKGGLPSNTSVALAGREWFESAIAAYREALKEWIRERVPLGWATVQMNIGAALERLGERYEAERMARLEEAVSAYSEALKQFTRARTPVEWATTQRHIGDALQSLGAKGGGTAAQMRAIVAYREALQEFTRARAPEEWAVTQVSLENSLLMLGEKDDARLEEAIAVYREVVDAGLNTQWPMVWSMARNNLWEALAIQEERRRDRRRGSKKPGFEVSP